MKKTNSETFAVTIYDKDIHWRSSSGGAFYAIAYEILSTYKGVVYGATIIGTNVYHKRIETVSSISTLMQSKYVVSEMRNCFNECLDDLKSGKYVFFVGTPCQIFALQSFLDFKSVSKEKLLTADLICHGAPQKKYFEMYLDELFHNDDDLKVVFKYKKPNWEKYSIFIKSKNKTFIEPHETNPYFSAFLGNYILLESCYKCKFKGENRLSDITLGDFWGCSQYYPEYYHKYGTSLVVIHNHNKGLKDILEKHCLVNGVDYHLSLRNNESYFISSKRPKDFNDVVNSINSVGLINTFKKRKPKLNYYSASFKQFIKKSITPKSRINSETKNVGIVTDYGYFNFGNRLQNYALRYLIQKEGKTPINLVFDKNYIVRKMVYIKYRFVKNNMISREYSIFKASLKSGEKNYFYDYSIKAKRDLSSFNSIILGSDQIWNMDYNKNNIYHNLAHFGVQNKINVSSYAASFGNDHIPERYKQLFFDSLSSVSNVGVREIEGQRILSEIGIQSNLNLDPVLILNKSEWLKSFTFCSKINSPTNYVFKYVLDSNEDCCVPDLFADLYLLDILDEKSPYFICNHFDFVRFISQSELVITNSFHALVFSIVFKKKIILLERKDMMSRFVSIFNLLGIDNFLNTVIDLEKVDMRKLEHERLLSQKYLKSILTFSNYK